MTMEIDEETSKALTSLFGLFRAIHWLHWTAHWQSKGSTSYGDHLLFERLYNSVIGDIDGFAEKMIGLFGPEIADPNVSMSLASLWLYRWTSGASEVTVAQTLDAELDLLSEVKTTYDLLTSKNVITLGMDDFLMALSNAHETNVYLLQQRQS